MHVAVHLWVLESPQLSEPIHYYLHLSPSPKRGIKPVSGQFVTHSIFWSFLNLPPGQML